MSRSTSVSYSFRRFAARIAALALSLYGAAAMADVSGAGRPSLWEVRSASNSVYLFGSLHVARPDFYPLPGPVEDAYARAQVLVVEVDIAIDDPEKTAALARSMMYTPPDGLDRHVTPATWKKLEGLTQTIGFDSAQLRPLRPAVLVSALAVAAMARVGYVPEAGIDQHFLKRAHADGKTVVELETAEFQAHLLADLTDTEGDELVAQTLDALRSGELQRELYGMAAAWKAGDVDGLAHWLEEANADPVSQKLFRRMFDERNGAMADKIAALAAAGTPAVVVVGAGHLAGRNSIVELLGAKGLDVHRVE